MAPQLLSWSIIKGAKSEEGGGHVGDVEEMWENQKDYVGSKNKKNHREG